MSVENNHTVVALGYWPKFSTTRIKTKLIAPCSRGFSGALSKLQEIATNSDCFIVLFVPVVIERGNYFGIGISITTLKPRYKKAIP